jgi:hypothetical protein
MLFKAPQKNTTEYLSVWRSNTWPILKSAAIMLGIFIVFILLTTQPFVAAIYTETAPKTVNPDLLKLYVKHLSEDTYPRSYNHAEHLEAAASYIEQAGLNPEEQQFLYVYRC